MEGGGGADGSQWASKDLGGERAGDAEGEVGGGWRKRCGVRRQGEHEHARVCRDVRAVDMRVWPCGHAYSHARTHSPAYVTSARACTPTHLRAFLRTQARINTSPHSRRRVPTL
eukprot:2713484-Pleurochrysis_carterae.AAC.1